MSTAHLLLPSGHSQERPSIWASWFKAFRETLQLAILQSPGLYLARQRVSDDNHPAVTVVPLALGRLWGFNSICVNNYQKDSVR